MSGYSIAFTITALCPCCGKEFPESHYMTESRSRPYPLDRDNPLERKDRRVFITPCADCFAPIATQQQLAEALMLCLPLAKGYAASHQVGSNAEIIAMAEVALSIAKAEGKAS